MTTAKHRGTRVPALTLGTRVRLFLHGAARELAAIDQLWRELRRYRDGFNTIVDAAVRSGTSQEGRVYVQLDGEVLRIALERTLGVEHPLAVLHREKLSNAVDLFEEDPE